MELGKVGISASGSALTLAVVAAVVVVVVLVRVVRSRLVAVRSRPVSMTTVTSLELRAAEVYHSDPHADKQ